MNAELSCQSLSANQTKSCLLEVYHGMALKSPFKLPLFFIKLQPLREKTFVRGGADLRYPGLTFLRRGDGGGAEPQYGL